MKAVAIATAPFKTWLQAETSYLPPTSSISQRIYHLRGGSYVNCICGSVTTWNKSTHTYNAYCSSKCAHNDPVFISNMQQKCVEKYGVAHFSQIETAKQKRIATTQSRYGATNNFWATRTPDDVSASYFTQRNVNANNTEVVQSLIDSGHTQAEIGTRIGITQPRVSSLLSHLDMQTITSTTTAVQREISQFLTDLGVDHVLNDRTVITPKELDIFCPLHNVAIEINGVYWHSELSGRDKLYHLDKTTMCNEKSVQLMHIYDYEWNTQKDIVKSRISTKLNKQTTRIWARKCTLRPITIDEEREFLVNSHIQGYSASSHAYGLIYDNELVSVMTFGTPRYTSTCQYELIRLCTKPYTTVVGGASKLMKHFVTTVNPSSIITYSDRRWGAGQIYNTLGFVYDGVSAPNYRYFKRTGDTSKLLSRVNFQKHKLPHKLDKYDEQCTEWENMQQNGYDRIWDCGNTRWIWQ